MNLKDGWNAFNHNFNYLPPVITIQHRILCSEIREVNLQALSESWENSAAAWKVVHSGGYLAATLNSHSYVKPEFMGPQNRCDGNHPNAMIKDFRALVHNMQDAIHRVALFSGMREFIKQPIVTSCICRMNNCTQWSSVSSMVLLFKLRV